MKYTKTSIAVSSALVIGTVWFVAHDHHTSPAGQIMLGPYSSPGRKPTITAILSPENLAQSKTSTPAHHTAKLEHRARIFDAPDVFSAIERVRNTGTPDEKRWAADALYACLIYARDVSKDPPELTKLREVNHAKEDRDVRAKQDAAFAALSERCKGARGLDPFAQATLLKDLQEGADARGPTPTPTQTLTALVGRNSAGDTRRSSAESKILNDALYGDDPLLLRLAFAVIVSSIDMKAPGGAARAGALSASMSWEMVARTGPMSNFEALVQCATTGECENGSTRPPPAGLADPESERLMAAYREAFAKRLPESQILSIH